MSFNEDSRVKIPALLHLCKLGYSYISLKNYNGLIDKETNIFVEIFNESLSKINPTIESRDKNKIFTELKLKLENNDLGKEFYHTIINQSGLKIIDFDNFENNAFNIVTELTYKNGEDEFRPDITVLINGIPLIFIEVKKPNNKEGILSERNRINIRFKNKKFKRFINILQLLIFSNNMEYEENTHNPVQGAFYSTTSLNKVKFNFFREEEQSRFHEISLNNYDEIENYILKDNNLQTTKYSEEFLINKDPKTPTNKIITSLLSKDRISFFLRYGICYVQKKDTIEKHIMRYPQFFASQEIVKKLNKDKTKGVIWHTQGSGKTALAFYNVHNLTNYFRYKNIVPKFYFIVDRLDLMEQASKEFISRGLKVHLINSKEELLSEFRKDSTPKNLDGRKEITVVNIQKFKEESDLIKGRDYNLNIQRVYFLDEVHRSYKPKGNFLTNLYNSDKGAILIGLTGTPLLKELGKTTSLFGDYIHKYYYNSSIADGYTLKLMREEIGSNYKIKLQEILKKISLSKGDLSRKKIYSDESFAKPMLDYILEDIANSRIRFGDKTFGSMVVCDSSEQAKELFKLFNEKIKKENSASQLKAALILHDVGDKDSRKEETEEFKDGKIDLLFVYQMLLTGFDSERLKKLYICRLVKEHNLLQTLTRVNRPYNDFKYGYVVDFADITEEFEKTNKAYFDELNYELGDEIKNFDNLFETKENIEKQIKQIKENLFDFNLENAEIFSKQISSIEDKKKIIEIKKSLENSKNIYNSIRINEHSDLLNILDFKKLSILFNETSRHLDNLNLKESLSKDNENSNLLNIALENIVFTFSKLSEKELIIADKLREKISKARESLNLNIDKKDKKFTNLYDELKRIFSNKNIEELKQDEMNEKIFQLDNIIKAANELNIQNNLLKNKYSNDSKFVKIHKRLFDELAIFGTKIDAFNTLSEIKKETDQKVLSNRQILNNEAFFNNMVLKIVSNSTDEFKKKDIQSLNMINGIIVREYINEFHKT